LVSEKEKDKIREVCGIRKIFLPTYMPLASEMIEASLITWSFFVHDKFNNSHSAKEYEWKQTHNNQKKMKKMYRAIQKILEYNK